MKIDQNEPVNLG